MGSKRSNALSGGRGLLSRAVCIWAPTLLTLTCVGAPAQQTPCNVPVSVAVRNSLPSMSFYNWKATVHNFELFSISHAAVGALGLESRNPDFANPAEFVSLKDWAMVRDLPAGLFVAREGARPVSILSVRTDRGPRRIVFMAENGAEMPEAARKIEVVLITDILSKARPEDSFALLNARGPQVRARFGDGRDAVRAAAESLGIPAQGKSRGGGVRDAILEAAQWLQPPQPGDSIFLLALRLEGRHQAEFSKVREAVSAGGVRVFAFQLGSYNADDPAIDRPDTEDPAFHVPAFDEAFVLSSGTGGMAVLADSESEIQYEAADPVRREFRLTDEFLDQLKGDAERMYAAATEFYVLQLSSAGPDVQIGLAPGAEKYLPEKLPVAMVVYPRNLPPCSNASGALPTKVKNP